MGLQWIGYTVIGLTVIQWIGFFNYSFIDYSFHIFHYGTRLFFFFLAFPYILMTVFAAATGIFIIIQRVFFGLPADYDDSRWDSSRKKWAAIIRIFSKFWNGFEVEGFENIPTSDTGGTLIVFYHGPGPMEPLYFGTHHLLERKKKLLIVADRILLRIPLLKEIIKYVGCIFGTYPEVVKLLKEGENVYIVPGGMYEMEFTNGYNLLWNNRKGYARAALEAGVPIVPGFMMNTREAIRNVYFWKRLQHWIYEKTRWPCMPIFGGFPVKLKVYLGKPILHDPNMSADELSKKTEEAVSSLIKKHQRIPGSVLMGMMDRFPNLLKHKNL